MQKPKNDKLDMKESQISISFTQNDFNVEMVSLPPFQESSISYTYQIGDEYEVTSTFGKQILTPDSLVKVKRKRDGVEEVLSYKYFKKK